MRPVGDRVAATLERTRAVFPLVVACSRVVATIERAAMVCHFTAPSDLATGPFRGYSLTGEMPTGGFGTGFSPSNPR